MPAFIATGPGGTIRLSLQEEHSGEAVEHQDEGASTPEGAEGEGHEGIEAPNPILPAKNEVIWGGLSFLILLVAMLKFLFPMIQKTMQARSDRIRESLDEAERVRAEAE